MTELALVEWEQFFADWFFVFSLVFLAFELLRYAFRKKLTWALAGDALTNFVTQAMYLVLNIVVYGAFYVAAFSFFYRFAMFDIGINWATVAVCIVLADFAYYWEHRFLHRVGIAWATHSVHHSSPHFNISVAYRFGPMDDLWPVFFHLPLVLLGFNPFVVFFSEVFVLLYQTALHTEVVGKLPKPVEAVMNTPSHHRVHHGSNDEYIDKNYGGIFIVWDRMFGTFAEEDEKVIYGIAEPLESVNPFVVFLHGLTRLWRRIQDTRGAANKLALLIKPPGWRPEANGGPPAAR
ncbi:MAG: sterol desaturase family protein [Proteobacteria bacterium]|nr:sterol desaturase family protein [Pseudomonadota bacterium]